MVTQTVNQEPLLAGEVSFRIRVRNNGTTPVVDRGYNLTITDTLPVGLTFVSANPTPTNVAAQPDGTTLLTWDNIVDLEAGEHLEVSLVASLAPTVRVGNELVNRVGARVNRMPDNSGAWVEAFHEITVRPQAIDIEAEILQSTRDEQATGAGEYAGAPGTKAGADWPFQMRIIIRNNNTGSTNNVQARVTLPAGLAYLGNVAFSSNPNNVPTPPSLRLNQDGSLDLTWSLGTLTTAQSSTPIVITFQVAIPYRYRTAGDNAARNGPFAGPMSGTIISEDAVMSVRYEAAGVYENTPTADGSESTPEDDPPAQVTAEIITIHKSASPTSVGIGTLITYTLNFYVSEYYTVTNAVLVDVLPDGMIYVEDSANLTPVSVQPDTPGVGQTTIIWEVPAGATTPGASGAITFLAQVEPIYKAAPLTNQPIVSGDTLTNRVTLSGDWADAVTPGRVGSLTPDNSSATVSTSMPAFSKQVLNPATQQWSASANAFVGDVLTFRLNFAAAADVDARSIIIRDFLPRGMMYVESSAIYTLNGVFTDGPGCTAAPQSPVTGMLGGLQYLEWRLCNVARGATWEARIQARVGPVPTVQPGWIVANFGKLTGANSYTKIYSLRDAALTHYKAPRLVLTKSATPDQNLVGGSQVNYIISVTNLGDAPAYNLNVLDIVPGGLLVAASGGAGSPAPSTYTVISGSPSTGAGGVLAWTPVSSLAPGQTQTFTYQATVTNGLPAGAALTNRASISYNSRPDNQGHAIAHSDNPEDDQTDELTIYLRGLRIVKSGARIGGEGPPEQVTIGDRMRWTLTVTVPAGVVAHWPVVEENDLPSGFIYVPGSRAIAGATFDDRHAQNPLISSNQLDLRFFLNSVDNSTGTTDYSFVLSFETIVTGVRADQPSVQLYTDNTKLNNAVNTTYVGWYDAATGYNNSGMAADSLNTALIDRRSPRGRFIASVRQPYLTLQKVASNNRVGAGDEILYTVLLRNQGTATAYDMKLRDVLPVGLTFLQIESIEKPANTGVTPTSAAGAAYAYWIDRLDAGQFVKITYRARVNDDVSTDSSLTNTASVENYSTQPGSPTIERTYTGPRMAVAVHTPQAGIAKRVNDGELTYGSTLVYSIVTPAEPVNATMYNVVVTDTVDGRLEILNVVNGQFNPETNLVTASFASVPPNTQQVVEITVRLPENSMIASAASAGRPMLMPEEFQDLQLLRRNAETDHVGAATPNTSVMPGALIYNRAYLRHDRGGLKSSNYVSNRVVAPALVVEHHAAQIEAAVGELLEYTVKVHNVGNGYARAVGVNVALPTNITLEPGNAKLNGAPFPLATLNGIALPDLPGGASHTLTFWARVNAADAGVAYVSVAQAVGTDSRGVPIPADNSARVPADTDPLDQAAARVYGPLAWTSESVFVAYEDLKNVGWSDWDYNDFIVKIDIAKGKTATETLAALVIDYEAIARGAAYDHRFLHRLPIYGGGNYQLSVRNADNQLVVHTSGAVEEEEPTFVIFERTKWALPVQNGIQDNRYKLFTNTAPMQTWVQKGWTARLQIVLADPAQNPLDALPPIPWDPYLHVIATNQTVHIVQPGRSGNTQVVNQAWDPSSPLAGYDLPLVQVFNTRWKWPQEFVGIWRPYPDYTLYQLSGGFYNQRWWDEETAQVLVEYLWLVGNAAVAALQPGQAFANPSHYYATPVVVDLDGDGEREIIIGNLTRWQLEVYDSRGKMRSGWPQLLRSGVKAAATVGDLNGDGKLDILVGDLRGYLHAFNADGTRLEGWSSQGLKTGLHPDAEYRILAQPAIADLDGDGRNEIVLALSDSRLYVYEANGTLRNGWPVSLGDAPDIYGSHVIDSTPVVADINGDGQQEIVVGSYDHRLYVYRADGRLLWTYETRDIIMSTPAIGDLVPGSPGLEIVIGSGDRFVYTLTSSGQLLWKHPTGWIVRSSPLLVDLDGDGQFEIVIGSDDKKVWAWHSNGAPVAGWPQATGAPVASSPIAVDLDKDGAPEIVAGSDNGAVYAWRRDGTLLKGWPKLTGCPIKGAPALLRNDGVFEPEIVVANYEGTLRVVGGPLRVYLPMIRR